MPALELYVAAFRARCQARRGAAQPLLDATGVIGLLGSAGRPVTRLLVTDDRARDTLAALARDEGRAIVTVLAAAARCTELLRGRPGWRAKPLTAMVCPDLRAVPAPPLPAGLTPRPVRRLAGDDGVPLEAAVGAALRADPSITDPPDAFAAYLRSLPGVRLLAAVDGGGAVRATSGAAVAGTVANAFFVNTDPDWRGRGVARAMTAAALLAAREAGARQGCLDATEAGFPIYRHLGFETLTRATQFVRT